MACTCGHAEEEHGDDPEFPGSTACREDLGLTGDDPCPCLAFEDDGEDDE